MNEQQINQQQETEIENIVDFVVDALQEKQGESVISIKLNNPIMADYMILVTAKNHVHAKALTEELAKSTKAHLKENSSEELYAYPKVSGQAESGWIVLDLNAVLVHVLLSDTRSEYDLDSLYEQRGIVFHH